MMSLGRLGEAWPLYRTRMNVRSSDPRGAAFAARLPPWDGVVRPGQRLLVWGEQGIGDQVLFGSMLPDLLASGADIVFGCDPRLEIGAASCRESVCQYGYTSVVAVSLKKN